MEKNVGKDWEIDPVPAYFQHKPAAFIGLHVVMKECREEEDAMTNESYIFLLNKYTIRS